MSTASKPELVRSDTGEVVTALVPFDMATYLADTKSDRALTQQKALMAAYDAACASLIGENDVQKEGSRTFKKKSAWRKLARHFGISVACALDSVRVERHDGGGFTAYAVANAMAPWGQSWTDVGACGSDEAVGRRVITEADAVATAMTRASNRAVSNLIAMGEVSAEEIGQRASHAPASPKAARDKRMPFGKTKGKLLGELSLQDLTNARTWCADTDAEKFKDLIAALDEVIGEKGGLAESFPPALEDETDDLPF